jgi:hypothetical protein
VRQFRREIAERINEADGIRRELQDQRVDAEELAALIARLRALDDRLVSGDPRALASLRTEVIPGLKEFEYGLRRRLMGDEAPRLLLGESDDVPEGYRELVEEYYRALSEGRR